MFECPAAGNFEDVCDCRRFFQCNHEGAGPVAVPCAAGTVYNDDGVCNWDWAEDLNVVCAVVSTEDLNVVCAVVSTKYLNVIGGVVCTEDLNAS